MSMSNLFIIISILYLLFLPIFLALEFKTSLSPQQRFCFYEVFEAQQKYSYISFKPQQSIKHEVQVSHIDGRQWKTVFFKTSEDNQPMIRVDKLASTSTTYSFCLKNLGNREHMFKIKFSTGIEMMELQNLPDMNDGQNLETELNWLDQQTTALSSRADNIEGLRRINYQISGMVGTKMIVFAVIGLIVIALVNVTFYRILKKTFKDRKLI